MTTFSPPSTAPPSSLTVPTRPQPPITSSEERHLDRVAKARTGSTRRSSAGSSRTSRCPTRKMRNPRWGEEELEVERATRTVRGGGRGRGERSSKKAEGEMEEGEEARRISRKARRTRGWREGEYEEGRRRQRTSSARGVRTPHPRVGRANRPRAVGPPRTRPEYPPNRNPTRTTTRSPSAAQEQAEQAAGTRTGCPRRRRVHQLGPRPGGGALATKMDGKTEQHSRQRGRELLHARPPGPDGRAQGWRTCR